MVSLSTSILCRGGRKTPAIFVVEGGGGRGAPSSPHPDPMSGLNESLFI